MTALSRWFASASPRKPIPFSRLRHLGFAVTLSLLLATGVSLGLRGLNLGLDFTGGVLVQAQRAAPFDVSALRGALSANGIPEAVVQLSDEGRAALIRSGLRDAEEGAQARIVAGVRAALGEGATLRSVETVGPKVSGELLRDGILAALLSVAAIAVYVWLRFEAKFGIAAFVTTFHDVAMIVGLFAITGLEFDLTTIAAMLAIAGYSINDTVIVFDRIRETLAIDRAAPIGEVIDRAVTDTLRRTLMTSGTTLVTSVALLAIGGPVLFGFAAAMTFGILVGTYSSIFVAAPLLIHLPGKLPGRDDAEPDAVSGG